jgi:hypothetical protein
LLRLKIPRQFFTTKVKPNYLSNAWKSKGSHAFFQRMTRIARHYGLSPQSMMDSLRQFTELLDKFNCTATFPIPAVILHRYASSIRKYYNSKIEFAIHGYAHNTYSSLDQGSIKSQINRAIEVFINTGFSPKGFRSPYLSRNSYLHKIAYEAGLSYISNQPYLWNIVEVPDDLSVKIESRKRILDFYNPWISDERPSIPRINHNIIDIPVSLPDDEILVDRLQGMTGLVIKIWLKMLELSYQRGELLTIQLHPERICVCRDCLKILLSEAQTLTPKVWIASLAEISAWWKSLNQAKAHISIDEDSTYHFDLCASNDVCILVRGVEITAPVKPFTDGFHLVNTSSFTLRSSHYPIIGISARTSSSLTNFLRQQGFIVEEAHGSRPYSIYLDRPSYDELQENSVLDYIADIPHPLIKLSRWPDGAQSALAITGDIDALTLWDYGFRLFDR